MTVDHPPAPDGGRTGPDSGLGRPLAQSADPIDRVVRLAPTWTVIVLIACGILVVGTILWAFRGEVTTSVSAPAIYKEGGALDVTSKAAASVDQVKVELGQQVSRGAQVVTLTDGTALVAPQDGVITSVLVSDGSAMWPGKVAARITSVSASDTVYAALPSRLTGTVVPGLAVRLEVSSAPSSKFGYLIGSVDEISADPYTTAQLADRLEMDESVITSALGTQPVLLAVIRLQQADTPSGYAWSVGSGPDSIISQGAPVTAYVVLTQERPIDVVFG